MKDSTPQEILYGLENFGIPTRNWTLEDAKRCIQLGLLTQEQVDKACKSYQEREDAKNTEEYGTTSPTQEQRLRYTLELLSKGRKIIESAEYPPNFVNMYSGKYSDGRELYTSSLGGCLATLLYFEGQNSREGIMTHYPPLNVGENISKLENLKDTHLKGRRQRQRGVILVQKSTDASQLLESGIKLIFPGINLDEPIVYGSRGIKAARLNPAGKYWESKEFGRREF